MMDEFASIDAYGCVFMTSKKHVEESLKVRFHLIPRGR